MHGNGFSADGDSTAASGGRGRYSGQTIVLRDNDRAAVSIGTKLEASVIYVEFVCRPRRPDAELIPGVRYISISAGAGKKRPSRSHRVHVGLGGGMAACGRRAHDQGARELAGARDVQLVAGSGVADADVAAAVKNHFRRKSMNIGGV